VHAGEVLLVMGPSGSGKTTLLQMLGALLRPTAGSILVTSRHQDSIDLATTSERELPALRAHTFGFIFQDYALLDALSATENIAVAANIAGTKGTAARDRAQQLLDDSEITSRDIRVNARLANPEGVGVIEAPRGTLFHHYWVSEEGKIEKVNLIVATGNNNYAMSRAVEEVARDYVKGPEVKEGMLNRVEAAIRAYDPCLSCSTHAVGQMPLEIRLIDSGGNLVDRKVR
jgi:ABC-type sugar transport system ATPase subunit